MPPEANSFYISMRHRGRRKLWVGQGVSGAEPLRLHAAAIAGSAINAEPCLKLKVTLRSG